MQLKLFQADAFTDELFRGNPAAVVPLKSWLPDSLLQSIALENNLAETAFIVRKGKNWQIRWFTPAVEVNLCGHATLASAHVLWQHLGYKDDFITFISPRSGRLGVTRSEEFYTLDFPTDRLEKTEAPLNLRQALHVEPIEVFRGNENYLLVFEKQAVVENLSPDFRMLKSVDSFGVICTAQGTDVDFVSRCFFPNAGIDEDPVTGSAHTSLTPYWATRLGKKELTARQISARGGFLKCQLCADRTHISGKAVTFLIGKIYL